MTITGKIKATSNKIKQNKAQYNLDRQTANISVLSSWNVSKYKFLTGKDVLSESKLLEKAAAMKRFEYSSLGKELKAQTFISNKNIKIVNEWLIKKEKLAVKKYNKSNLNLKQP